MLKLLIVDDEKRTRDGLKQCISWKECGYGEVREADDGTTALEIIGDYEPDIILSDILMPKMTGIDMAKQIQSKLPQCKFVFISGYSDKEYLKDAILLKAIDYIEKPINVPELEACMRKVAADCQREQHKRKSDQEVIVRLETSVELLRGNCALYLTERHPQPWNIRRMLDLSGLELPVSGSYVSAVFKFAPPGNDTVGSSEPNLPLGLYEAVCDGLLADKATFTAGIKDGQLVLVHILLTGTLSRGKLQSLLESVAQEFGTPGNPLYAGIGQKAPNLESVHSSYETALLAVNRAIFFGGGSVAIYGDSSSAPASGETLEAAFDHFSQFAGMIERNDSAVFSHLERIAAEIRRRTYIRIDDVKMLFFKLHLLLYNEAKNKFLGRFAEERKEELLWLRVSNAATLVELLQFLASEIREYFAAIHDRGSTSRVVYNVIQYIQRNYRNGNITISEIANALSLTPAYLCQLFKKETGQTINDYCNAYKIEKAKQLLTDRTIKLLEVASETGYNDVKYFTRTFKRITGITPSVYRENISK